MITVYFFRNYESLDCEKSEAQLSPERAEKYRRLKQTRDRENCLASYLLLKGALRKVGISDHTTYTDGNGKPFLKNESKSFNISHCRRGVAVAVGDEPVGIDIQDITPYNPRVADRVCTEAEKNYLAAVTDRDRAFTRLWTLKEAAAKCDGRGLGIMQTFSLENNETTFKKYGKNFITYEFDDLVISVCGSEDISNITEVKDLEVF